VKRKTNAVRNQPRRGERPRLLELALLVLPFIALTPNFFIIPDLTYQGNATLEVALAWLLTIFLGLALYTFFKSESSPALTKQQLQLILPLGGFIIWQIFSLLWAHDWSEGLRLIELWVGFAVFFVSGYLLLSRRGSQWLYYSMTLMVLILAISQFIEYRQFEGNMLGVFFSHGITTELLALTLPLQLAVFLSDKRRWLAIISLLVAAAGGAAIILTLRRGALLGLSVASMLIALALIRRWVPIAERWRIILIGAAFLLFITGPLLFRREYFLERMRSAFQIQTAAVGRVTDIGLTSRLTKWLTAWEMGKHNPLLGVGLGGYPTRYGEYRQYFIANPRYAKIAAASEAEDFDEIRNPQAHSEYLQIFAELGIPGVLLFAAFWLGVGYLLWRARRTVESHIALGALGGLVAFAISSGMSAFSFRFAPGTIIAACVAAIGCAAARRGLVDEVPATESEPTQKGIQIPRLAVLAGVFILFLSAALLILRARDVLASQKVQSQVDFRISLDNPAVNESLIRRYNQALTLDSENSGAHLGLGLLLYQLKRPAEAVPHLEFALRRSYGRPYTYLLLAFAKEQTGDIEQARKLLEESLTSYPRSVVTRAAYIEFLQKLGQNEAAVYQQSLIDQRDFILGHSWQLALRMKGPAATAQAKMENLIPPDNLEPMLVRAIVQARAYHYLK
jgi:putative inorganic carbon (HCO3(-)) transporter